MTTILGISAFYHDSAAALVVDGEVIAAAQEERFTRKKHDEEFPTHAVEYCLSEAGITPEQLDYVAFYDKPLMKFERLLETYLAFAPSGFRSFLRALPIWLKQKLYLPLEIRKGLGGKYRKKLIFTEHHESHAASAFFPSPFEEAAILTIDGVGEWATASWGIGRGNEIQLRGELRFPHSLGLLYSAFTYFCGFRVNSGEYKLMGLAPYGVPRFREQILKHVVELCEDGSFRLNQRYFDYCTGLRMTSREFEQIFEGPPRKAESPLTQREMDLAASVQSVTEEIMLRMARYVQKETGAKYLCLAGGVALNCVGNGKILREGIFEDLWIQPAAGDAGGALGAAWFVWHQLLGKPREVTGTDHQKGSYLGPSFSDQEIKRFLDAQGARYLQFDSDETLCRDIAARINQGKVIGWFQGRMEFGPRALGARSILGDPRNREMQSKMNLKIKFRESFRPFAPSVMQEHVAKWFQMRAGQESPYMLLVAPVNEHVRIPIEETTPVEGIQKLKLLRSTIPAVTHVDHSARVQTVDRVRNPRYHLLLEEFHKLSGCPLVINTSFNVRSEPIVCSPEHAYRCFLATNIDVLVLERFVLLREEQAGLKNHQIDEYLAQFDLD